MIIQVLPAIRTQSGIRIPRMGGPGWSNVVRPEVFAQELSDVNRQNAGKVVPIVKLFKGLNDRLTDDVKLTGYHIEALAVDAFRQYAGSTNPKDMLIHFSRSASENILHPLKDNTGQSRNVDEYLGPENSIQRQKASAALRRISDQMKTADSRASLDEWSFLFGD
jgi:hypothetical protein